MRNLLLASAMIISMNYASANQTAPAAPAAPAVHEDAAAAPAEKQETCVKGKPDYKKCMKKQGHK